MATSISWDLSLQPIVLYIVQIMLIILLTQILSKLLKYLKQPRVISEMIAGIILGPSVMGHIKGFQETVFPVPSLRAIEVNADLGLMLFIFMVGTQIDFSLLEGFHSSSSSSSSPLSSQNLQNNENNNNSSRVFQSIRNNNSILDNNWISTFTNLFQIDIKRWRSLLGVPVLIATTGVIVPLSCGIALGWGLFKNPRYHAHSTALTPFVLFIGVALSMSALAVLARMLTERRMLHRPIGALALMTSSVGVLESWVVMELATSFSQIDWDPSEVFWNILFAFSDILLLLAVLKPIITLIVRRVEKEQEMSVMNFFYLISIALGFATVCEFSGISSSLGAMLVGMVLPRTNGGQITRQALSERLEDITSLFFLPLFFTISGINTNFHKLYAVDWGICFLLFIVAFIAKTSSVAIVARFFSILSIRESFCYGVLMQSKGLLALVVFNDALSADIISSEMFSILVAYVILSSVITVPLVDWIYPSQKPNRLSNNYNLGQHSTVVVASHPRQVRAMVSIVTALVKPNYQRERDQVQDKLITAKILKDNDRLSAPFTSLSLSKEVVQRNYIRRDNVMAAARKRFSDLNVANGPLRLEQQLHVVTNTHEDMTIIAQSNNADLMIISGPEPSFIPANNVGLPVVSLSEAELFEFSTNQAPCDTAVYYDKGPILEPHVGKVLCAVVLGLEGESSTALRLCARMRPKVEVEVLHIVAPGIGDNLELLNSMIAICTQKSMSYRVVINSNPMAALFEALNDNYPEMREDGDDTNFLDPNMPNYYINRSDGLPPGAKRPYSLVVVGALPIHLSQFLVSNASCGVLLVYPKGQSKTNNNTNEATSPPSSPPLSTNIRGSILGDRGGVIGDIPLGIQPAPHASVSLMSIVAGASAPQVIHPEVISSSPSLPLPLPNLSLGPSRPSPLSSSSTPVSASGSPITSPPIVKKTLSSHSIELSPFHDWPSPPPKSLSRVPSFVDSDDKVSLLSHTSPLRQSEDYNLQPNNNTAILHSSSLSSPNPPTLTSNSLEPEPVSPSIRGSLLADPLPGHRVLPPLSPNSLSIHLASLSHPGQLIPHPHTDQGAVFPDSSKGKTPITPHSNVNNHINNANTNSDPLPNPFLDISPFGQPDHSFPPASSSSSSRPPIIPIPLSAVQPIFPTPTNHSHLPSSSPSIHSTPLHVTPTQSPTVSFHVPPSSSPATSFHHLPPVSSLDRSLLASPFGDDTGRSVFPGSTPAELPKSHIFGPHFDFTVPSPSLTRKSSSQMLFELPLDVWSQVCTHLTLNEVAMLTRVNSTLQKNIMIHNSVWGAIATARWPEAQSNATAGINWKQLCLLYHSKSFPHLVLRDYTGTARGRFHIVSCLFIGDDSEMGGAESVFFLNKISKGAAVSRASLKANVMTLEYAPYYFLTVSLSQLSKVVIPWERTSAIVVPILTRSSQNTNIDTVLPKRYITELVTVLQEAVPTSPLIVFFHFNPTPNTTPSSNSGDTTTFVQKLVATLHGLILKSPHPFRKLLVQQYNFRSGSGFSDGLWWMVSNINQPPSLLREEVLLSISRV